jgi:predicted nucleotidyltransferase
MRPFIYENIQMIQNILKANKVKEAYLFGSSTGVDYTGDSDVDIVISFEENLDPLVRAGGRGISRHQFSSHEPRRRNNLLIRNP